MALIDPTGWMVLVIVLPLASAILTYVASGAARWIGVAAALVTTIPVACLAHGVWRTGILSHTIGGAPQPPIWWDKIPVRHTLCARQATGIVITRAAATPIQRAALDAR